MNPVVVVGVSEVLVRQVAEAFRKEDPVVILDSISERSMNVSYTPLADELEDDLRKMQQLHRRMLDNERSDWRQTQDLKIHGPPTKQARVMRLKPTKKGSRRRRPRR